MIKRYMTVEQIINSLIDNHISLEDKFYSEEYVKNLERIYGGKRK